MKKYALLVGLFLIPLVLFAQSEISVIQNVIYEPSVAQNNSASFSSPLTLGFSMYHLHISLAYGSELKEGSTSQYLNLIDHLKDITSYNIMDILEFESNKEVAINKYLSNLDKYLLESDFALVNLKEEMSLLDASAKDCLSQKSLSDKQYLDSVQGQYQQSLLDESLENSKKYAQCASDARIEYNAKKTILNKITGYRSDIKVKYDYISANKNDIVKHYSLIKDNALQRLINVKRLLQKYDL